MRKILPLLLGLILLATAGLPVSAAPLARGAATGVITDPDGRPLAGAEVEVYRLGEGLVAVLATDEAGGFRLPVEPSGGGLSLLRVWAKGYRLLETGWMDLSTHPYQSLRLEPLLGNCQVALHDQEGKPLTGRITLVAADGRIVAEGETTGGRYRADGLVAGPYRVVARASGHLIGSTTVTVTPGQTAATVLSLTADSFAVTGQVEDGTTLQPIARATVQLIDADRVEVATGSTDAQGRFRLVGPGLAPQEYQVRVAATGYRATETAAVQLAPGDERDFTGGEAVRLQPNSTTVSGVLLNTYGSKLPDAQVVLELKGYGEWATTRTDQEGDYRFEGVPWQSDTLVRLSSGETNNRFMTGWLTLKSAGWNQVLLQNQEEIKLTFGIGDVSGIVLTPSGAPVAGAKVELIRSSVEPRSVETDAEGAFLLKDVPGTVQGSWSTTPYTVRISKAGYRATAEFTVDGQERTGLVVVPRSRTMLKAVLPPAEVTSSGRVTDAAGRAVAGARVRLQADGVEQWAASTTDAFGWYSLQAVPIRPDTTYWLAVEAEGYVTPVPLDVTATVTGTAALPSVRLQKAESQVSGLVLRPDGSAVAEATVTLIGPLGQQLGQALTDEAGFYALQAALPAGGSLQLSASREGYSRLLVEVPSPAAGQALTRNLTLLSATATLSGRVLDAGVQGVAGATVELLEEGRGVVATMRTTADGRYRFEAISLGGPGWFWLRVRPASGRFVGSPTSQTDLVPLQRLLPGQERVLDLLVR